MFCSGDWMYCSRNSTNYTATTVSTPSHYNQWILGVFVPGHIPKWNAYHTLLSKPPLSLSCTITCRVFTLREDVLWEQKPGQSRLSTQICLALRTVGATHANSATSAKFGNQVTGSSVLLYNDFAVCRFLFWIWTALQQLCANQDLELPKVPPYPRA